MEDKKLTIIVIDESEENLIAFKSMVSNALPGTNVFTATKGSEALKLARTHEPDIILIDISMSKSDGLKISQIIRKERNLQLIPMLFITDLDNDRKYREQMVKAGADAFLVKPIDEMILISQLKVMAKIKERNILINTQKEQLEDLVKSRTSDLIKEIKERKILETELRRSEKLFSSYIHKAPIGIFVVNELGNYIDANQMACQMMGRTYKEVLGLSIADYLSLDQVEEGMIAFNKYLKNGSLTSEYKVRKKNSPDYWISLYGTKINDNCFLAFCIDITERKAAEEINRLLSQDLKDMTKELAKKSETLSLRLQQTISAISIIGEMKDGYTAGHQKRVALLACAIARVMGLSEESINNISIGAQIHDIGKINIPSDILNKPGKISSLEYQMLQSHVVNSYEIVKGIDFPIQVVQMIYQHHERMDGSGYPLGLKGEEILLESRILSVADVVEAMCSHRPYRPALGIEAALAEIVRNKGVTFDATVVDVCVSLFLEHGFTFSES
jgi:PAS domain S-box-containing protein/putative nucleotidyltransferase with HDIG domain